MAFINISPDPCPICDGNIDARGFSWVCPNCGFISARSSLHHDDKYYDRIMFSREKYRMEHWLPFEKRNRSVPDELYLEIKTVKTSMNPSSKQAVLWEKVGDSNFKCQFMSLEHDTIEEALGDVTNWIDAQEKRIIINRHPGDK